MDFKFNNTNITSQKCELLVIATYENQKISGKLKKIDNKLNGALRKKIRDRNFKGEFGKSITIDTLGKLYPSSVMVFGIGKKKDFTPDKIFRAGGIVARSLEKDVTDIAVDFQLDNRKWYVSSLIEGLSAGSYSFDKYKTKDKNVKENKDKSFTIVVKNPGSRTLKNEHQYAKSISEAVLNTRNIVNEPPIYLTPARLAEIARNIADKGNLEIDIMDTDRIEENKMGCILAVTRGSGQPPKFIHMIYTPSGKKPKKEVAVVGKGITFDSGGLNLKPGESMRTMKMDMGGAASVLGIMEAISRIKPNVKVHGLIPTCENMTGAMAYKPDDVIFAMNGKSIEIINTDAEGRLILADALSYCSRIKPDEIIDFATLTGACIVALGNTTAGIMGNDQRLIDKISEAAGMVGEKVWQLPMDDDIKKELESDVADIKNAGSRAGGAIYAAHFLGNFIPEGAKWSHLDIAGPVFMSKGNNMYTPGATGFGVRTVVRYLSEL